MNKKGPALSDPAIAGESNGFTLVEILVVISIIAILGAISFGVFTTLQKNNRDQIRMRDLQGIKQALELYRSNKGDYPATADMPGALTLNEEYLAVWPTDSISGQFYTYAKASTGIGFVVCAKKEGNMADTTITDCLSAKCDSINTCNIGLQSD